MAERLSHFVAHSNAVSAACIGHSSGQVLATGGEDKKVNLWRIGRPGCLQTLGGAKSAVDAVRFGFREQVLFAGSRGGTARLYDLAKGKVKASLQGHRSSCLVGGFHPHNGAIVASGSQDTNLKVWDVRTRSCVQTYKGHKGAIRCLQFSPDGQWVATGADDGAVKLWDLSAGRLLTEFTTHRGAVTTLCFHPNEFLLATGSVDRTVKFWDLESFDIVSSTAADSSKLRAMSFTSDGDGPLAVAAEDGLKLWTWEPSRCVGQSDADWGRIADVAVVECRDGADSERLVACSFKQAFVGVYVVNVDAMQPSENEAQRASGRDQARPVRRSPAEQKRVSPAPAPAPVANAFTRTPSAAVGGGDTDEAPEIDDEDIPSAASPPSSPPAARTSSSGVDRAAQQPRSPPSSSPAAHARASSADRAVHQPRSARTPESASPQRHAEQRNSGGCRSNGAPAAAEAKHGERHQLRPSTPPPPNSAGRSARGEGGTADDDEGAAFARGGPLCHTPPARRYVDAKRGAPDGGHGSGGATAAAVHSAAAAAVQGAVRAGAGAMRSARERIEGEGSRASAPQQDAPPTRSLSRSGRHVSVGTEMGDSFAQGHAPQSRANDDARSDTRARLPRPRFGDGGGGGGGVAEPKASAAALAPPQQRLGAKALVPLSRNAPAGERARASRLVPGACNSTVRARRWG